MKQILALVLGSLVLAGCSNNPVASTQAPLAEVSEVSSNDELTVARALASSVIINEVAWSGTKAATTHEWIELRNTSSAAVNLAGWRLSYLSGCCSNQELNLTGSIPANGFYLIERNEAATNVPADLVSTTISLNNTGGDLRLIDGSSIVDSVGNGGAWPAGTASTLYKSMERSLDGSSLDGSSLDGIWKSNDGINRNGLDSAGNPLNASPKAPTYGGILQPGDVLLNEVVVKAQADRNGDGANGVADQYVELLIQKDGLDLTGLTLLMNDATPTSQVVKGLYFGNGGTIKSTKAGDYILIADPAGTMDTNTTLSLSLGSLSLDTLTVNGSLSTSASTEATSRVGNTVVQQRETAGFSNDKNGVPR